ncbi:hypothetical protein VTN96DRAFT_560 [Rasamsonia emersonii]
MRLLLLPLAKSPYRLRYPGVGPCQPLFSFSYAVPTRSRRAGRSFFYYYFFSPSRTYASANANAAAAPFTEETVQVPVGGNGCVRLSVLHPPRVAATKPARPNVILYLPPGPVFSRQERDVKGGNSDGAGGENDASSTGSADSEEGEGKQLRRDSPQHVLASTTTSTVVTLNYRLGYMPGEQAVAKQSPPQQQQFYKYPTPVHDTLAGLDWILQELQPAQLFVFGTHVGGSLALMLALTEARHIQAIAAYEPICDWTELDEYCTIAPEDIEKALTPSTVKGRGTEKKEKERQRAMELLLAQIKRKTTRRRRGPAPVDLVPLLDARERFFDTPEKYFDSFASPMIFLRSPGKDVPKTSPKYHTGPEYPVPVLQIPQLKEEELIDLWDMFMLPDEEMAAASTATASAEDDEERPMRRRKALSRWPPYGLEDGVSAPSWENYGIRRLEVTLPWVRLFASGPAGGSSVEAGAESSPNSGGGETEGTPRRRRSSNERTVLARQAEEMVSVMRRACFWGREKGYGERRVELSWTPKMSSAGNEPEPKLKSPASAHTVEKEAGYWFREIMEVNASGSS